MAPWPAATILLLASLSALWHVRVDATTKWRDCSPKSAPVQVEDVEMSPDPPVSGHNFTLLLPALTQRELDGGTVYVSIYYYNVPVRWQTENLCDKAQCPVAPGNVVFRHVQSLPPFTPTGHYSVRLSAEDSASNSLFCTDVSLNVVRQTVAGQGAQDARRLAWGRGWVVPKAGGLTAWQVVLALWSGVHQALSRNLGSILERSTGWSRKEF